MRGSLLAFGVALAASVALLVPGAFAAGIELPPGPNRDLVYGQCRTCHDLQYLADSAGIPRDAWDAVLNNMRQFGLRIPPEQRAKTLDYLATYLGPNPPPAHEAAAPDAAAPANGETLFKSMCTGCHQPNGKGVDGVFPPLAGNSDLYLGADFPVLVVLFGMKGQITVAGSSYASEMPPFGHLSDAEIAALVNHVRSAWGNDGLNSRNLPAVEPAQVGAAREKKMTPQEVLTFRKSLL